MNKQLFTRHQTKRWKTDAALLTRTVCYCNWLQRRCSPHCGGGYTAVCVCQNPYNCPPERVRFIPRQCYLNKVDTATREGDRQGRSGAYELTSCLSSISFRLLGYMLSQWSNTGHSPSISEHFTFTPPADTFSVPRRVSGT